MGYTEADAIEEVRIDLWASCQDFPLTDLHDWQATYLGKHLWSVTSTWIDPLGEHWHLEWRVHELERAEKPANQATAIFEDIMRNWCRSLRPW
jgi:hypothetical protein